MKVIVKRVIIQVGELVEIAVDVDAVGVVRVGDDAVAFLARIR